jgi:hypothetical protein
MYERGMTSMIQSKLGFNSFCLREGGDYWRKILHKSIWLKENRDLITVIIYSFPDFILCLNRSNHFC